MPGLRFTLDLYIPEDPTGTLVAGVKIPTALATQIPTIRQKIQALKGFARKINSGQPNEEMTVKASYHVCHHEDNPPTCGDLEQDI